MSCILYKNGETLRCNPADMAREIAAGWSVTDPSRVKSKAPEPVNEDCGLEPANEGGRLKGLSKKKTKAV